MAAVYGWLSCVATFCVVEALRPPHRNAENETTASGAAIVAGICAGLIVGLALGVGT